jgi:UPF0755 protein
MELDHVSFDEDYSSESHDSADPHVLIFGDDHPDDLDVHPHDEAHADVESRGSRAQRSRRRREARRRRVFAILAVLVVAAIVVTGYVAYNVRGGSNKDYAGSGTGSVTIQVQQGDGIDAIGTTLVHDGVIGSSHAFRNAAAANINSNNIQPGYYKLRKQMSASSALALLLDPSSLVDSKVPIPEGLIEKDIVAKIATALAVSAAAVQKAADDVADLAPGGYQPASGPLTSLEGFLYPATYQFNPGTTPSDAVQQLITAYTSEDRSIGFATAAVKLGITPYQALIIASIAQAEVKFPEDAPKVARVILNRIAAGKPLQVDATSAYAAKVQGLDPTKVVYSQLNTPYNTYTHAGLPPTPIGSPGETSMQAAVNPAVGDWLFYVNGDAAGHLVFFDNQDDFTKAQQACHDNNWGCAAP